MASRLFLVAASVAGVLLAGSAGAVTVFTSGSTYSENFDSMAVTGALPAGWTTNTSSLLVGAGTSTAGGTYSFGAAGSSDRALGVLNTNALLPVLTATFTNGGTAAITALDVSYFGEIWRFGGSTSRGGAVDRLDFTYAIGSGPAVAVNALDLPGFTYSGIVAAAAKDGNTIKNALGATISGLNIGVGETITFTWTDLNVPGSDDGLAIDDFSLAATFTAAPAPVPEPASWTMMIAGFGLLGATMRRRRAAIAFG